MVLLVITVWVVKSRAFSYDAGMDNFFKDKRVTVMGLGLLGRGVGDAIYVAEAGAAEVIVTDLKSRSELNPSVTQLESYENIRFVFGKHDEVDFKDTDIVLVAAGVPLDSSYLKYARQAGVRLTQSAALFAELSGIPIIGVTGTRGKSTVTHMIHHVLEQVTGERVLLGGNIRGVSNLQLLKEVKEDSLCVMELDSWQLQGWGWAKLSPDIAVFTNFMPDHLNYYKKGDITYEDALKQYFSDKANIFRYQDEHGVLITTPEVFTKAQTYAADLDLNIGQEVILADSSAISEDALLAMPGEHNRLNAALAYEALRALSLEDAEIFPALASFTGVEGRLQYCGSIEQVAVYNDNNATTPQALVAGLQAVGTPEKSNVILVAGGADKGIDLAPLVPVIQRYCKQLFLIPGTGTDRLIEALKNDTATAGMYRTYPTLSEAVKAGLAFGEPGDLLLFSPGFASFGQYANEYERNDVFMKEITKRITDNH